MAFNLSFGIAFTGLLVVKTTFDAAVT